MDDDFERRMELRRQRREQMRLEAERMSYGMTADDDEEAARERRRRAREERMKNKELEESGCPATEVINTNSVTPDASVTEAAPSSAGGAEEEAALQERLAKREERRQKRMKEALDRQKELDPTVTTANGTAETGSHRDAEKEEQVTVPETNSWSREEEKEEEEEKKKGNSVIVLSDSEGGEGEDGVIDLTEDSPKKKKKAADAKEVNGTRAACENGLGKKANVTGVGALMALLPALPGPVVELSPATRSQLEELQLEGDLLEVSLDQTSALHRVLQANSPPPRIALHTLIQIELQEQKGAGRGGRAKDSKRKRKSQRGDSGAGEGGPQSLDASESKKTRPLNHSPSPQLPAQTHPEIL